MKLDPCRNCNGPLSYISEVPTTPIPTLVLKCSNCDTVFHLDKPEGWHTAGENLNAREAREQGTSYVRDHKPEDEIKSLVAEISQLPPDRIDEDLLKNVSARITLVSLVSLMGSKRPTVRMAAVKELSRIIWKSARTDIDVTSKGQALQAKTTEQLMSDASGLLERLSALKTNDEDASTGS